MTRRVDLSGMANTIRPAAGRQTDGLGLLSGLAEARNTRRREVLDAPVASLADHPDNPRDTLGDLTELTDSIRSRGVIQPLIVVTIEAWTRADNPPVHSDTQWVVIAGHRRLAAARLAENHTVPVIVDDDLAAHDAAIKTMIVENIHRQNLDPLGEAIAMQSLADSGMSQRDIAADTGVSQATVSKRLRLLDLTAAAQSALRDGTLSAEVAVDLLKVPKRTQDDVLTAGLRTGNMRGAISAARAQVARDRKRDKVIKDLRANNTTVVDDPAAHLGINWDTLYDEHRLRDTDAPHDADGIFASVDMHGNVRWWSTTPTTRDIPDPVTARTARAAAVARHLSTIDTDSSIRLLESLALLLANWTVDPAAIDVFAAGITDTDSDHRLKTAIATLAAVIDTGTVQQDTDEPITETGDEYLHLLAETTGYTSWDDPHTDGDPQ